jgi:hypothetical protein
VRSGPACAFLILFFLFCPADPPGPADAAETPPASADTAKAVLRVYDWKSGAIYLDAPVRTGGRLSFRWVHSLEKFPWSEYYNISADRTLVLDAISFPAFGAGVPADKGRVCRIESGLIHMEKINQKFSELVWLNSHTATREILLDGAEVVRGEDLPNHVRLRLVIEKGYGDGSN